MAPLFTVSVAVIATPPLKNKRFATFAAQPRGTRRLLSVRFASDFVSMSARPGAVADAEVLADLKDPLVIDVRDPSEVASGKGGPPAKIPGSVNVPLNIDGVKQSERPTTQDEFLDNIKKAIDALPDYHEYGERFCDMPSNIHELLCGPQPNPHMLHLAAGADGKKKMEGLGSDAMRTLACVLYILKYQAGPLDALTASIDLGGDVDSVAALVLGAIAATDGLKFGEKGGLSWKLLEELEGVEYLMKHAKEYSEWLEKQGQNGEEEEEAALMPTLGRGAMLTGLAVAAVAVVGMVAWRRR